MDILQIALVLFIVLLGVFLSVMGIQVFFILRDLNKALDRATGENPPTGGAKETKSAPTPKSVIPPRRLFKRK